jgi:hypothetical protein
MKLSLALLVLTFAQPFYSQIVYTRPTCQVELKDLPEIRGIKLRMDRNAFLSLFNGNPAVYAAEPNMKGLPAFKDVTGIWFDFYKEKLSRIEIEYDNSITWDGNREFQTNVSENLKLPYAWNAQAEMTCKDFQVKVRTSPTSLEITDLTAKQGAVTDKKREEDAKKKAFKP